MPRAKPWTEPELDILRKLFPHYSTKAVMYALRRSERAISGQAHALGLYKTPEYLASEYSRRIQRGKKDPRLTASQFKPGMTPWNKGVKGVTGVQEACRRTQFKQGRPASESRNYRPIGSLRLSKDGYLQRKLTDDPTIIPPQRWRAVHRIVWEEANGPTPPGHIVVFKSKFLKTTVVEEITLDKLECVSRAENMRRNSYHNYPPEVARLVQLKGAINRQVNRIEKEANP